jgi:hypothetical protein
MSLDKHMEQSFPREPKVVFQAVLAGLEKLDAKTVKSEPEQYRIELKLPKVMLGKTLGERTYVTCEARAQEVGALLVVDAYPLDALERKLLFGARKGVTQMAVDMLLEQVGQHLA